MNLVKANDHILHEVMPPVIFDGPQKILLADLKQIARRMHQLMSTTNEANQIGLGIAAPQVGLRLRMFVMDLAHPDHRKFKITARVCINPSFEKLEETMVPSNEGCLTWPGKQATKIRYKAIRAHWLNTNGVKKSKELYDLAAIVFQHELDHLDGKTIF
jgi:peptide deformylase